MFNIQCYISEIKLLQTVFTFDISFTFEVDLFCYLMNNANIYWIDIPLLRLSVFLFVLNRCKFCLLSSKPIRSHLPHGIDDIFFDPKNIKIFDEPFVIVPFLFLFHAGHQVCDLCSGKLVRHDRG